MADVIEQDRDAIPADVAAALVDPRTFADPAKIDAIFTTLRATQPVAKVVTPDFSSFWLISKHDDVLEIERQPELFNNGELSTILAPKPMLDAVQGLIGSPHLIRTLINMDGREHRVFRGLTQSWFMPGNVRKLEDRIRVIAKASVAKMLATGGECDFVADVALHYPLHVIMEILGVPPEDEPRMLVLTQQLFGARDPELTRSAAAINDSSAMLGMFQAVLGDFYAYFQKISDDRRAHPRDDLASIIANAEVDGAPIADIDANAYYVLVATAGHDTTSASTAGAMWALAERPDQLAKLKADPSLIAGLVDEAIRWVTPVKHFMRTATQDYELRGKTIRKGDWLMLAYLSANRDEEAFGDPFEFRVDRVPNKQVAFGYGAHACLGQHLARKEMRILMEELLPHLATVELAGEPAWSQSNFVGGPKRLPIRFTTA